MENPYKEMSQKDLWKEIIALVQSTHFCEPDKGLFLQLINEFAHRKAEEPK